MNKKDIVIVIIITVLFIILSNTLINSLQDKGCTEEYIPVCGKINVQCIKAPCYPVWQTFLNICDANKAKAFDIYQGECESLITNFKECVDAGNPTMESYPRQCIANGETFVEGLCDLFENKNTGELGCFGCAYTVCKTPTLDWMLIEEKSNECKIFEGECAI